jgi:hypothetical protein
MFKQRDTRDNAHPIVERFLPVNVREATMAYAALLPSMPHDTHFPLHQRTLMLGYDGPLQ